MKFSQAQSFQWERVGYTSGLIVSKTQRFLLESDAFQTNNNINSFTEISRPNKIIVQRALVLNFATELVVHDSRCTEFAFFARSVDLYTQNSWERGQGVYISLIINIINIIFCGVFGKKRNVSPPIKVLIAPGLNRELHRRLPIGCTIK